MIRGMAPDRRVWTARPPASPDLIRRRERSTRTIASVYPHGRDNPPIVPRPNRPRTISHEDLETAQLDACPISDPPVVLSSPYLSAAGPLQSRVHVCIEDLWRINGEVHKHCFRYAPDSLQFCEENILTSLAQSVRSGGSAGGREDRAEGRLHIRPTVVLARMRIVLRIVLRITLGLGAYYFAYYSDDCVRISSRITLLFQLTGLAGPSCVPTSGRAAEPGRRVC